MNFYEAKHKVSSMGLTALEAGVRSVVLDDTVRDMNHSELIIEKGIDQRFLKPPAVGKAGSDVALSLAIPWDTHVATSSANFLNFCTTSW